MRRGLNPRDVHFAELFDVVQHIAELLGITPFPQA
jgi:hypothetical protein